MGWDGTVDCTTRVIAWRENDLLHVCRKFKLKIRKN